MRSTNVQVFDDFRHFMYVNFVETKFSVLPCCAAPFGRLTMHPPKLGCFDRLKRQPLGRIPTQAAHDAKGATMATGTVKFFNTQKGFGFITPSDGSKDVFVHISAVERAGMSTLNEGQRLTYEIVTERGKQAASNLQNA
jgi:CspA family cold shock protein